MKEKDMSRRGFLKTAAAVGAALSLQPAFNKVRAATSALAGDTAAAKNKDMQYRTLGTGKAAFPVVGDSYNAEQQRQVGH